MARLDIESFQKGIESKLKLIKKLESQVAHLRKKVEKTIYCKKCNNYWDSMYLMQVVSVNKGCLLTLKCPICGGSHQLIVPNFDKHIELYEDKKYMYNIFTNKVEECKNWM